jgi:gamma-glutamylcyclotransferase (GGCT)/AIG2-like uncharacterized protein YtfP
LLYFAYTARIDPVRMAAAAPGAEFRFVAHLPEHGLEWPIADGDWGGGLPSLIPNTAATVWGAVFAVPEPEFPALDEAEGAEGRTASTTQVIDRTGKRHTVTVHVAAAGSGNGHRPSTAYVDLMLDGSRHWALPAGWIAGLEELRT